MFPIPFDEVNESHLVQIVSDQLPESMVLDFKREIDLSQQSAKAEAAKDVSAFANSAGGRIFIGIDEKTQPDGSKVADQIKPIPQGDVPDRLEAIIHSAVHPRPRFRVRNIPVQGGYVVLLEVYPSLGRDLHMVTAYGDMRFHRRSESHTQKMTEPEVREAYVRIATAHADLRSQLETTIDRSISNVSEATEIIVIAPVYGRVGLVNPSQLGTAIDFGVHLNNSTLSEFGQYVGAPRFRLCSQGYQYRNNDGPGRIGPDGYMSVDRTGIFVMAESLRDDADAVKMQMPIVRSFHRMLCAMVTAKHLCQLTNYWGPVHVVHRWHFEKPAWLSNDLNRHGSFLQSGDRQCDAGVYYHPLPDFYLPAANPTDMRQAIRELLDLMWQTFGHQKCPWFDDAGDLVEQMRNRLGTSARFVTTK